MGFVASYTRSARPDASLQGEGSRGLQVPRNLAGSPIHPRKHTRKKINSAPAGDPQFFLLGSHDSRRRPPESCSTSFSGADKILKHPLISGWHLLPAVWGCVLFGLAPECSPLFYVIRHIRKGLCAHHHPPPPRSGRWASPHLYPIILCTLNARTFLCGLVIFFFLPKNVFLSPVLFCLWSEFS